MTSPQRAPTEPGRTARVRRRLALGFAAAAVLVTCRKILPWALAPAHGALRYAATFNYAILAPNYFNSGFVRRGLGGAILALFDRGDKEAGLVGLHVLGAIWLAIPLAILLRRLARLGGWTWLWFGLVLTLSPQLFLAWSREIGKTDMMVCGFIAWALLAALGRRYLLAAGALLLGSLVHETAIIFGAPLCVAVGFLDLKRGATTVRRGLIALSVLAAGLGLVTVAQQAFGPAPQHIARIVLSQGRPEFMRDVAAYMTSGGARMLMTSACISLAKPAVALQLASCFVALALYSLVLLTNSWTALRVLAFSALVPMAAVSVIAIDYGRWLSFAVLTAWLAAVAPRLNGTVSFRDSQRRYAVAVPVFIILLAGGAGTVFSADIAVERLAGRLWPGGDEDPSHYLSPCDPDWRSVLETTTPRVGRR